MSNYTKPTIMLVDSGALNAVASSCSTSTEDAKEIKNILESMGYNLNDPNTFGMYECENGILLEEYCKFASSIQIFFS